MPCKVQPEMKRDEAAALVRLALVGLRVFRGDTPTLSHADAEFAEAAIDGYAAVLRAIHAHDANHAHVQEVEHGEGKQATRPRSRKANT